jgi:uncharacterized protein YqjF (DUF2071 family)
METSVALDRLAMRAKPPGSPAMSQTWENLLFLHWPIDPGVIRPLIPAPLEIDTFEGNAWIGITPFAMTALRLNSFPSIPGIGSFLELNVRTYVHHDGVPGIWFLSLDASKLIPAMAARLLFMLPHFRADMEFVQNDTQFRFESKRTASAMAEFTATWQIGQRLREPHLDSLAFFLVERYGFFSGTDRGLSMTRIYHHPWILEEALVLSYRSTMIAAVGPPEPDNSPLAHFSRKMNVEVWAPTPV